MKKKKLIIIIAIALLALIIAGVLVYIFVFKDRKKNKPTPKPNNVVTETITIKFETNCDEKIEDQKIKKGDTYQLPTIPRDGYKFLGWFIGDEEISDDHIYNEDTTITAKWEETKDDEETMKIIFDSKGGNKINSMNISCKDGVAIISNLPKPKKDFYEFMSWEDKHGKSILDGAKLTCTNELKLSAVWEYDGPVANTDPNANNKYFTVSFDSQGGSKVASVKVECGKTLKLPAEPTRDGYTFEKWIDLYETPILNDALLSCEDITLYARWTKKEYTCQYGFELKDKTKCVKLANPEYTCPTGFEYSEKAKTCYSFKGYLSGENTECQSGYVYKTATDLGNATSPGCYEIRSATKKCPDGYVLNSAYAETNRECALIKDATYE